MIWSIDDNENDIHAIIRTETVSDDENWKLMMKTEN